MSLVRFAQYKIDAYGFPIISRLEILRYRRYVNLSTAARDLKIGEKHLRYYELGLREPRRKNREILERTFGLSWEQLQRPAPHDFGREKRT